MRAYDCSQRLSMQNKGYRDRLADFFGREVFEDMTGTGPRTERKDLAGSLLFKNSEKSEACMIAKQEGILAGVEEVAWFYKINRLEVEVYKNDGEKVKPGDKVMRVNGPTCHILNLERTGLNLVQRMSGIATAVRNLKAKLNGHKTVIVATRKTMDRYLDKKAVTLGGGLAHRLGLYDGIIVKDNYLTALENSGKDPIKEAIELASMMILDKKLKFIEIEVSSKKDAITAARGFRKAMADINEAKMAGKASCKEVNPDDFVPCLIMLDNMTPKEAREVVKSLKEEKLHDYVILEASGGITDKNARRYAEAGIDAISIGAVTHSVKALDLSQKILRE